MAKKQTLKMEMAAMTDGELVKELVRSVREAWGDFLFASGKQEHKKVVYGKKHHREKRLATEILQRLNTRNREEL